jgi:4'-phosphopantetheinyl transferase
VHVWAAALDVPCDRRHRLAATLSPEERQRAARFGSSELRRRWTAGRGLLREILCHYLAVEPAELRFGHNAHGKPMLAGEAQRLIAFNLARSGGLGVYALTSSHAVGVDLEEVREFPEMRAMAGNTFSRSERAALEAVSREDYLAAFYRCWTRKEAFLKARGTGLLAPLDSFDVEVVPDRPAALLRVSGDAAAPGQWTLLNLEPALGYLGALAVGAPTCQVTVRAGSWRSPN